MLADLVYLYMMHRTFRLEIVLAELKTWYNAKKKNIEYSYGNITTESYAMT